MATAKKTPAKAETDGVRDDGLHYLDRYGHRHEISEQDAEEAAEEQSLPALPPAD